MRAKLGLDCVEQNVVGAAPTPIEVLEFFDALGLPIQEVWGMSETSAVATINPPDAVAVRDVRRARSPAASCGSPTTASCSCAATT